MLGRPGGASLAEIGQEGDAGRVRPRGPVQWNAARVRCEGKDQHARLAGKVENRRPARLARVAAGAGRLDVQSRQPVEGFQQSGAAPIEDVVVGQDATIDPAAVRQSAFSGLMR